MAYKVIIMPPAKRRLDMYVSYTLEKLKMKNRQAARAILRMQKQGCIDKAITNLTYYRDALIKKDW